ncbi:MAG TPA: hypothetical protein VGW10_14495, partial [Solirubrobacteraceae bacterium]|nr:hypothetical protein [Solirubrobacteraceae bacterium]
ADSFQVASRLWKEDALRASVVAEATAAAQKDAAQGGDSVSDVAAEVDRVEQLGLPVGWGGTNGGDVLAHIPGWLLTAFALTMGAPFWFDVLGKLANVRATGNREGTRKDDARVPIDRDDPSGTRPPPATPAEPT